MTEHRVRHIFERQAAGDFASVFDYLDDNIVYNLRGAWTIYPFRNAIYGKPAVTEMLNVYNVRYENQGTRFHEFLIDGDYVATHRTVKLRHRGTGEVAEIDLVTFIRFRDGLIVEFSEYPDSAALARFEGLPDHV